MTTTRDPRRDPRPGDVLEFKSTVYTVADMTKNREFIQYSTEHPFGLEMRPWCSIHWWREEFEKAEVLHAAD